MQKLPDHLCLHSDIAGKIINAAMEVHNKLGSGYQEIIYHKAMIIALRKRGLFVESEKEFTVIFNNCIVGIHKLDLVVERIIVVELKVAIGEMPEVFKAQVISYLKVSGLEVSLLINFGNESLDVHC
jgi:GxxExxY protein